MNKYEDFVTNYRRHIHAARSLDEAYRTNEYCSGITMPEKKPSVWFELLVNFVFNMIFFGGLGAILFWATNQ